MVIVGQRRFSEYTEAVACLQKHTAGCLRLAQCQHHIKGHSSKAQAIAAPVHLPAEDGAGWAVLPRFERLILDRSSQVDQILAVTAVHHPVLGQLPALDGEHTVGIPGQCNTSKWELARPT